MPPARGQIAVANVEASIPVPPIVVPKPVMELSGVGTRANCRSFDANDPECTGIARFL
jgi:hypothetical protein